MRSWLAIVKAIAARPLTKEVSALLIDSCLEQLHLLDSYARLPAQLQTANHSDLAELAQQRYLEIYDLQMEAGWSVMAGLYDHYVIERIKTASQEIDQEVKDTSLEILAEGLADRRLARAMLDRMNQSGSLKRAKIAEGGQAFLQEACLWPDYWLREIAAAALSGQEGGTPMEEQEMISLLDKVLLLKDHELFSCLQLEELGYVARIARQEIYRENTLLLEEGQPNSKLYLIIKGSLELSAQANGGINSTLAVLGKGEVIGENTVFDEALSPITAEVILGDAALLTIDGDDIKRLCSLYPSIANGFIKAMSARIRRLEKMLTKMA